MNNNINKESENHEWLYILLWNVWNNDLRNLNKFLNWDAKNLDKSEYEFISNVYEWIDNQKFQTYSSNKLRVSEEKQNIINNVESDIDWIKKFIEMTIRRVFKDIIDSAWINWKAYLTSNYDDIFSWIDLIMALEKWEEDFMEIWVDISISNNSEYVSEKKEKRKLTKPIEYNLNKGYSPNKEMKRIVINFKPEVIKIFLQKIMNSLWKNSWLSSWESLQYMREAYNEVKTDDDLKNIMKIIQVNTKNHIEKNA